MVEKVCHIRIPAKIWKKINLIAINREISFNKMINEILENLTNVETTKLSKVSKKPAKKKKKKPLKKKIK